MKLFLVLLASYLIGSVPFALVVGKFFYKTDVRQHGSGNLGGGNTGRVLGKKAGVAVMTLDLLKVSFVVFLAEVICGSDPAVACCTLAAAAGHCWPVFARFKGGKAVATLYGFAFGLLAVLGYSPLVFFLPLLVFLAVLYITKIISLSSMLSAAAVTLYSFLAEHPLPISLAFVIFTLLIVVRHIPNIRRMAEGRENKIKWM